MELIVGIIVLSLVVVVLVYALFASLTREPKPPLGAINAPPPAEAGGGAQPAGAQPPPPQQANAPGAPVPVVITTTQTTVRQKRNWNLGWLPSLPWKSVAIGVIFIVGVLGLYRLGRWAWIYFSTTSPDTQNAAGASTPTPNPGASLGWWDGLPPQLQLLIYAAVAVLLVVQLKNAFKGSSARVFKAGGFVLQAITGLVVAALLFAVLYPLNPQAALFTTDEGHAHIAMYAAAIIALVMVGTNLKKGAWLMATAILIIVFALLGPETLRLYDPTGSVRAKLHLSSFGGSGTGQVASEKSHCPGIAPTAPTLFGEKWEPINLFGCDITYAVTKGSIKFDGPSGGEEVSENGNVTGRRDYQILTNARASVGTAQMFYMLCPRGKGPVDGGWNCRS